jgi:drug/metabolite transporter (DMT)-like permease
VPARVPLVYVGICVLWGSTWLAAKLGLEDLPPLRLVAARMILSTLLLAPLALRGRVLRLPAREWRWVLAIGLLQATIPYALMFIGQTMVPSALAAVLFCTFPIWLVLLGWWLVPGERLTGRKLLLALVGLGGVALLQLEARSVGAGDDRLGLGALLITAGAFSCALANALVRRRGLVHSPVVMTFVQTLGASAALTLAAVALEGGAPGAWTARALGSIGYLAVGGTVLTYLGLYWLLPRVSLVAVGTIPLVDTTVALTLGTLVAGERLTGVMLAGAALVLLAAALSISSAPAQAPGGMAPAGQPR